MSERLPPDPQGTAPEDPGGLGPETRQLNWVERYDVAQRASGILAPVLTALLAFFVGWDLVVCGARYCERSTGHRDAEDAA